jgi:hypothetical protein
VDEKSTYRAQGYYLNRLYMRLCLLAGTWVAASRDILGFADSSSTGILGKSIKNNQMLVSRINGYFVFFFIG